MGVLNEVAAKLAALGLGTVGTDIHMGSLPATPDVAIAVQEYGGMSGEMGFGTPGIRTEIPALQILVRGVPHDYAGPRVRAETAYQGLARVEAETLSAGLGGTSAFYESIHPQQPPFELRRDGNQRVEIAFNVTCRKDLSA